MSIMSKDDNIIRLLLSNKYLCNKCQNNKIKILFNTYEFLGAITLSMKYMKLSLIESFIDDKILCLIDSATTHTILKTTNVFPT